MSYVANINELVKSGDRQIFKKANQDGKLFNQKLRKFRKIHLDRLGGKYGSPGLSLFYVDILSSFRRIKEHALNVAEIIAIER
jgi:Na+/phosphate symporter